MKVITLTVLVREDDMDEVRQGLINLVTYDASLGAYANERDLTDDDRQIWADTLEDSESEE